MTEGVVAGANSRRDEAIKFLAEALTFWTCSRIFERQAAETAIQLFSICGDERLLQRPETWAHLYPLTKIASRLRQVKQRTVPV